MKTTIKAKIIIETDKYSDIYSDNPINLHKISKEIENGHYIIEWINSDLSNEQEPTIIIKL